MLQEEKRKVLHYKHEVADAHNVFNIPGEWSYSTDLMWKEQEVPATVIGVDKSAGVRKADGTLNDSWCRVGYL